MFWLLVVGQLQLTAGTNGLTNFSTVFGRSKYAPGTNEFLFGLAAVGLFVTLVIARQVVKSRYGRLLVATRDGEDRVRFLGYDPAVTKTFAFATSAGMAGLAGALSAPIIGIVAPNQFAVLPSILMVAWVAIGGRTSIYGAVIGALFVSWGKTSFSESRPDDWLYLQGLLFVVVVAFFPGGIVGLLHSLARLVSAPFKRFRRSEASGRRRGRRGERAGPRTRHRDGDMTVPVLELRDLAVSFDGFKALDGVNLVVHEGELRFLIGPNGAGKTTVVDCITGPHETRQRRDPLPRPFDPRDEGAPDRPAGDRAQLPDADGVRGADRDREPRPRGDVPPSVPPAAAPAHRRAARSVGDPRAHRAHAVRRGAGEAAEPRSEAVARDRHAAGAGARPAPARRAGGRHEPTGAAGNR